MADIGFTGEYRDMTIDAGSLMDLRKMAGQPPTPNKRWVMVNLQTGELKWYSSRRRTNYRGRRRY